MRLPIQKFVCTFFISSFFCTGFAISDPEWKAEVQSRGVFDCFDLGSKEIPQKTHCEPSAAVYDGDRLYIGNDKPIPGENHSAIFSFRLDQNNQPIQKTIEYHTSKTFLNAIKYEDFTLSPDRKVIIATTGFDRAPKASAEDRKFDRYNALMSWPLGSPDRVMLAHPTVNKGVRSSVSLRDKISGALRTLEFPAGAPYFKIEGLAALPGNRVLFGVREYGSKYSGFNYSIRLVVGSYILDQTGLRIIGNLRSIHDFSTRAIPVTKKRVALSSIEYDSHTNHIWLLTSYEAEPVGREKNDEDVGAFLWGLKLDDWNARPEIVKDTNGKPFHFAHKAEAVAVLGPGKLIVVHDDDRVLGLPERKDFDPTQHFTRKRNEGAYTIIDVEK